MSADCCSLAHVTDPGLSERSRSTRSSDRAFFGTAALVFVISALVTVAWSASMSRMTGIAMPGGRAMSVCWARMPGRTWFAAAASFLGMWAVMMVAMMLPSLVPMLLRYRRAVGGSDATRMDLLTAVVGAGYFFAWALVGVPVFALGAGLAAAGTRHPELARAVPVVGGMVVMICGALQFTRWKAHRLSCGRRAPVSTHTASGGAGSAWRHGVRLAIHCGFCCGNLMAVLIAIGMMDLRAMALMTTAMTAERVAPGGKRVARGIGVVVVGIGLVLIARPVAIG